MSRRLAEVIQRREEMFPDLSIDAHLRVPTAEEIAVFARYKLSASAMDMAMYSARRCEATAAECYAAIYRSLI